MMAEKRERILETARKLKACAARDACEETDCVYFAHMSEIGELAEFAETALKVSTFTDRAAGSFFERSAE